MNISDALKGDFGLAFIGLLVLLGGIRLTGQTKPIVKLFGILIAEGGFIFGAQSLRVPQSTIFLMSLVLLVIMAGLEIPNGLSKKGSTVFALVCAFLVGVALIVLVPTVLGMVKVPSGTVGQVLSAGYSAIGEGVKFFVELFTKANAR